MEIILVNGISFVKGMGDYKLEKMFTLFKPTKTFPEIKNINLKVIQMYMVKFEESLKNLDDFHRESLKSN